MFDVSNTLLSFGNTIFEIMFVLCNLLYNVNKWKSIGTFFPSDFSFSFELWGHLLMLFYNNHMEEQKERTQAVIYKITI